MAFLRILKLRETGLLQYYELKWFHTKINEEEPNKSIAEVRLYHMREVVGLYLLSVLIALCIFILEKVISKNLN